jgi:hypothetical protein
VSCEGNMPGGKHDGSIRDFWWYDSIREIPEDGLGRQPENQARQEHVRILQLRGTIHRIGECTLQADKDPAEIIAEIRMLAATELITIEQWQF